MVLNCLGSSEPPPSSKVIWIILLKSGTWTEKKQNKTKNNLFSRVTQIVQPLHAGQIVKSTFRTVHTIVYPPYINNAICVSLI